MQPAGATEYSLRTSLQMQIGLDSALIAWNLRATVWSPPATTKRGRLPSSDPQNNMDHSSTLDQYLTMTGMQNAISIQTIPLTCEEYKHRSRKL